jgi:hypothetical protein
MWGAQRRVAAALTACAAAGAAAARGFAGRAHNLPRWAAGAQHELPPGAPVSAAGLLALNTLHDNPGARKQARAARALSEAVGVHTRTPPLTCAACCLPDANSASAWGEASALAWARRPRAATRARKRAAVRGAQARLFLARAHAAAPETLGFCARVFAAYQAWPSLRKRSSRSRAFCASSTGNKPHLAFEGGQTPLRRRLPKRGFVNTCALCARSLGRTHTCALLLPRTLLRRPPTRTEPHTRAPATRAALPGPLPVFPRQRVDAPEPAEPGHD